MSAPAAAPGTYRRRRSGTATWHMSRKAVSLSVPEVLAWSTEKCLDYLVQARFGGWDTVTCPHCGSIGKHYWRALESRWKCAGCQKTFSVTSGTPFSHRKLPLQKILSSILLWVNSAAGQPALQLKRNLDVAYNTAYTLQHRIREAMVRGYNVGFVSGDLEMDGAHQSGRRAAEKRGKPQGSRPVDGTTPASELTEMMLTQTGRQKARKRKPEGAIDPEFGRRLPKDRRIVLAVMRRSGQRGKGGLGTRVAVGLAETAPVAEAVMKDYIAVPESELNTDTSPAYLELGKRFRTHRKVEHAKELIGPNGENNNQVESLNWRQDRAERGIYLNIEPKYLLDYAAETAFRSDTRRLPNGQQLKLAMGITMSIGRSLFWTGYTHGRHRTVELLHPVPQPAKASGPRKGRHPVAAMNGRPPR